MPFKNAHMVFKVPGTMAKNVGVSYDYLVVEAEDVAVKVAKGWSADLVSAQAKAAAPEPEPVADDNAPPTREELEEQCKKLGIKVDGRYSDRRLLSMIEEKMAEG